MFVNFKIATFAYNNSIITMPAIALDFGIKCQDIKEIYESSFPDEERRPWPDLCIKTSDGAIALVGITHEGTPIGFFTIWDLGDFNYIEHFAIGAAYRCLGAGAAALDSLLAIKSDKPMVIEVERAATSDLADRRISFYMRHGFRPYHDFDYIQPPYSSELGAVPLTLMSTADIDPASVESALHKCVYGVGRE